MPYDRLDWFLDRHLFGRSVLFYSSEWDSVVWWCRTNNVCLCQCVCMFLLAVLLPVGCILLKLLLILVIKWESNALFLKKKIKNLSYACSSNKYFAPHFSLKDVFVWLVPCTKSRVYNFNFSENIGNFGRTKILWFSALFGLIFFLKFWKVLTEF